MIRALLLFAACKPAPDPMHCYAGSIFRGGDAGTSSECFCSFARISFRQEITDCKPANYPNGACCAKSECMGYYCSCFDPSVGSCDGGVVNSCGVSEQPFTGYCTPAP